MHSCSFLSKGTNSHWWTQNSYYLETDVKGIDNSDKSFTSLRNVLLESWSLSWEYSRIRELNQQSQSISTHFPQLLSFLWWLCCQSTSCKRWKVPSCYGLMKSLLKEHNPWGLCSALSGSWPLEPCIWLTLPLCVFSCPSKCGLTGEHPMTAHLSDALL